MKLGLESWVEESVAMLLPVPVAVLLPAEPAFVEPTTEFDADDATEEVAVLAAATLLLVLLFFFTAKNLSMP